MNDALLPHVANWTEARRRTAQKYLAQIRHPAIQLLSPERESEPGWHLFPILAGEGLRDPLRDYLQSCGIMTGVHYPRLICDQAALGQGGWEAATELVNARAFVSRELSLPIHPFLTDVEVDTVIAACNAWKV
jgi:dTDP-3-amino-3,4,6-trideoxy-alpha-D-glucose transaminase